MDLIESVMPNDMWDLVWQTFANASLTYDLVSSQNETRGTSDENLFFDNPAKLGILTGFLIACLADFRIAAPKLDVCLDSKLKTMAMMIINLISFMILAPLVFGILVIFFTYRKIVEVILKIELKTNFAGVMKGTDSIWALEDTTALSVINALAIFEVDEATSNEQFLLDFRNVIQNRLISSNFEKLNWLRRKKYGYFFWHKCKDIQIEEQVRWLYDEEDHENCDGSCDDVSGNFLKFVITKATTKFLPKEHSTCWEILVGKNCSKSSSKCLQKDNEIYLTLGDGSSGLKRKIPVLFRIHHCVGDGVALLRLLLESIVDSEITSKSRSVAASKIEFPEAIIVSGVDDDNQEFRVPLLKKSSSILGMFRNQNEVVYYSNDLVCASMPFTTIIEVHKMMVSAFSSIDSRFQIMRNITIDNFKEKMINMFENSWTTFKKNFLYEIHRKIKEICEFVVILISVPSCLIQQHLRSMDNSALHGPTLSGKKIVSYWMESDDKNPQNLNLLSKIRDIKDATGTRFGDVVLAALSSNLHRYFAKIDEAAPRMMTVVIPIRMTKPMKKLNLDNAFSVGLLPLCISEVNGEFVKNEVSEDSKLLERLGDISRCSEKLRNDPDYLINFWVMKWLAAALPEPILKRAMKSNSTLVFSNLPGPQQVAVLGYKLKNIAFWIPHRGSTGVGCSLLTYAGKVHISLVADTAVVRNQKMLDEILQNTIEDIQNLYDTISLSCFAMNLRDRTEAPMESCKFPGENISLNMSEKCSEFF